MRTLYVAWKDVIENPRPDGVPSKFTKRRVSRMGRKASTKEPKPTLKLVLNIKVGTISLLPS